jgi:hypothetical protein
MSTRFSKFVPAALLFGALTCTTPAFGSTTFFVGPQLPDGTVCSPAQVGCINGDPSLYEIFGASLTTPTATNPDFVLVIQTNYSAPITTPGSAVPTAIWGVDGQPYSISDFLINWNGGSYGVIVSPHVEAGVAVDGYVAGDLYQAAGFQTSGSVIPNSPRPNEDVWLQGGGTLQSTSPGSVSVATTGDGITSAMYSITVQFSAPADFLSTGVFTIDDSSFVCANGILTGAGTPGVPEPGTIFLIGPALLLLSLFVRRHRRA